MAISDKLIQDGSHPKLKPKHPNIIYPDRDDSYSVYDRMSRMVQIARISNLPVETKFNGIPFTITSDVRVDQFESIYNEAIKRYNEAKQIGNVQLPEIER